jgi:hypothetical protein
MAYNKLIKICGQFTFGFPQFPFQFYNALATNSNNNNNNNDNKNNNNNNHSHGYAVNWFTLAAWRTEGSMQSSFAKSTDTARRTSSGFLRCLSSRYERAAGGGER